MYLGSISSKQEGPDKDVKSQIDKASAAFMNSKNI